MIYCLNCGKGIPDQSKFCTFCGTPVKAADVQQPESNTPPVTEQHTNPTPPQQQYVAPTPPPIPPQYSNTPPPPPPPQYSSTPQPQYSNPTPPQTVQQYANTTATRSAVVTKNEFYKNVGFGGAALIICGAFLPWETSGDIFDFSSPNLLDLFSYGFNTSPESSDAATGVVVWEIALIIILACALLILIDSFANFLSKGLSNLFKLLPFIVTVLMLVLLFFGLKDKMDSDQFADMMQKVGIGIWVTLLGIILLLFYKKRRKII
ncbi:MAG TPA: zinc-ribbon domain-containing protein [Chitinophagaceae bacterium]